MEKPAKPQRPVAKTPKINPIHEEFIVNFVARNKELSQAVGALQAATKSISGIIDEKELVDAHLRIADAAKSIVTAIEHLREAGKYHINNQPKQQ